jgi:hypothetical protein
MARRRRRQQHRPICHLVVGRMHHSCSYCPADRHTIRIRPHQKPIGLVTTPSRSSCQAMSLIARHNVAGEQLAGSALHGPG